MIRDCYLLCKRPSCCHSASKTQADRIFKLSPVHASVIYQIPWNRWISDPFRENPINTTDLNKTCGRAEKTGWCRTPRVKPQFICIWPPHTVSRSLAVRFSRAEPRVVQGNVVDPSEVAFLLYVIESDPRVSWKTNERTVVVPWFLGGSTPEGVQQPIILPKNCMKMKEFGMRVWWEVGGVSLVPLWSATDEGKRRLWSVWTLTYRFHCNAM